MVPLTVGSCISTAKNVTTTTLRGYPVQAMITLSRACFPLQYQAQSVYARQLAAVSVARTTAISDTRPFVWWLSTGSL